MGERLENLQEVEVPPLEVVLKGEDEKVAVGDNGMSEQRLVGEIAKLKASVFYFPRTR